MSAPPRVVLFRPMPLDRDTRAKKFAATLARGGYDVIILSPVETGADLAEKRMGSVRIVPVAVSTRHRDAANRKALVRRQAQLPLISREDAESFATRIAEQKQDLRRNADRARRLSAEASGAVGTAKRVGVRAQRELLKVRFKATRGRQGAQRKLDQTIANAWRGLDVARRQTTVLATAYGVLPEIHDYADAFAPVLDQLAPDLIHAHHPFILHTAVRAARRRRANGHACKVIYDARENFAGIPEGEQGNVRRHHVLVLQEKETIRDFAGVITVSDPIADELQDRYRLTARPAVVLNVPVAVEPAAGPSLREVVGVPRDAALLVYSGGISKSRGLETLVTALGDLPDMHLAIVAVPFPHPSVPALLELAESVGAADRIHVTGPVPQHQIAHFLSSADIAIHPMPGGSPNHDQASPNKLFEYLHAGLPLVVSDAKLMAAFVREHRVGESFTSGDAASLVKAVTSLRADPPTAEHLAAVAQEYSWQGQEPQILALYDDISGWTSNPVEGDAIDLEVMEGAKP